MPVSVRSETLFDVQEAARARDWTVGMTAYEKLLASLKPVTDAESSEQPPKKKRKMERNLKVALICCNMRT